MRPLTQRSKQKVKIQSVMSVETDFSADLKFGDVQVDLETRVAQAWSALAAVLDDERLHYDTCVRICAADEIAGLNETYRDKPTPTNVLSFPADLPVPEIQVLGDIVICWPVIQTEAGAQGKSDLDHFSHMVIHGLLHLLGYDHELSEADAQRMEALECVVLAKLGIANPYR